MKPTAELTPKKTYAPPQLLKYGSLAEMTEATGTGSKGDSQKQGKGVKS